MAFWSDAKWKSLDGSGYPVRPFDPSRIEEASYQLAIVREVYISAPEAKGRIHQLSHHEAFTLKPGQFAFILTEEAVVLPFHVIGFITIRASIKFYGLVNVSGFHVDPGYSGKLIFAVFNAGPTNIHLRQGDQIFSLWLSDLDQAITRTSSKEGYQHIPSRLVNQVSGEFLTAYELVERIDSQRAELRRIGEDVNKLKAFKWQVVAVAGAIVIVLGLIFQGPVLGWLAGAYSDAKEEFRPSVGTEMPGTIGGSGAPDDPSAR